MGAVPIYYQLRKMGRVAVAYSGGVDSTFLLKAAHDALKEDVIAVTVRSPVYPEKELRASVAFAQKTGIKHVVITADVLDIEGFADNPVNRCYLCKRGIFSKIGAVAREHGMHFVLEGSNADDTGDYRPGMEALKELGVVSPLQEAGMTKAEIRRLSREMSLPTWNKPASACLASRFPYGSRITKHALGMVDEAEQFLIDTGFTQVRVRHHGDTARIEVSPYERIRFFHGGLTDRVYEVFRELGFVYVTLDIKGYRTGSMNEMIDIPVLR
jgi:uncharacterized protein